MEFTLASAPVVGLAAEIREVKYANGPILKPAGRADLPPYEPVAFFRTELAKNDTPVGVVINSPAMVHGTFGKGRVFISSPHPEQTPGLDRTIEHAARWTAGRPTP